VSLEHFFECYFGPRHGERFEAARECFTQSMAAYSLVCYFLQVKDRHNGNILIDSNGHIVHIDFGFMLSSSPGGNMNFENVPFKLTEEYVRVMDGELSDTFNTFRMLFIRGFLEARRHAHKFVLLAEMLLDANINAFVRGRAAVDAFRARFCLELSEDACVEHAMTLIERSCNHWRSERYDEYQRVTNGIL
jgi:phosphatidylinositol 4-kinase